MHLVATFGSALRCDCYKDPLKAAVTSTLYYRNAGSDVNVTLVFHHKRVEARYPIGWGYPSVLTAPSLEEPMWYGIVLRYPLLLLLPLSFPLPLSLPLFLLQPLPCV